MLKRPYVTRGKPNGGPGYSSRPRNGKGNIPPPAPKRGRGRPRGSHTRITRTLKEALLLAAEWAGEDLNGTNGVTGYCYRLAVLEPRSFAALLGRILPLEISAKVDVAELRQPYESLEQAEQAMYELGLQPTRLYDTLMIEGTATEVTEVADTTPTPDKH